MPEQLSLDLSKDFSLDRAVEHYFHKHPLYTAIKWYYYFKRDQTDMILEAALRGPRFSEGIVARMNLKLNRRLVLVQDAPQVFWQYWIMWMCPSMAQITQWRLDLIGHVVRIMQAYQGRYTDEPIFRCSPQLIDAMKKEFPDRAELLQRSLESKFGSPIEQYTDLLTGQEGLKWQSQNTYIIDYENPNKDNLFHVIELCVRLLTEFLLNRRQELLEDKISHGGIMKQVKTDAGTFPGLQFWVTVAAPLNPDNFPLINLNKIKFWTDPYVLTLVEHAGSFPDVRNLIQCIFVYSDVDPVIGLIPALHEVNNSVTNKQWKNEYENISALHRAVKPMMENPWLRHNTVWESGLISQSNYNILKVLLSRVPPTGVDSAVEAGEPLRDKPEDSNLLLYGAVGAAAVAAYALT